MICLCADLGICSVSSVLPYNASKKQTRVHTDTANEIPGLSRTFQALFLGFSRAKIRDLTYQTILLSFKF